MEWIIVGMICFSKIDTDSMCLPFEQNPIVSYKSLDKCMKETERRKTVLRTMFNKEGLLVDELVVACVNNPYKSNI